MPENSGVLSTIANKINYFGDNSNLHGVGYVLSLSHIPGFRRLFWLLILVSCGLGTFTILRAALGLYTQGSVSFSVDTNYLSFNTPFPAVTLCEQLEVDRIKHFMAIKKLPITLNTFFKEVFFYSNKYCRTCISCKLNSTCLENFVDIVKEHRAKCEEMLTDCWWADKPFNCCERFRPLQTEYGECYSFNSQLTGNHSLLYLNRQVGLPSLVFTANRSVSVRIHSPDDEISAKVENILGQSGAMPLVTEFNATLKAEATTSDISIQTLDPERRGCLLADEHPAFAQLWPFKRYSYSGCVLYCRLIMQVDSCNCTHHFMPKLKQINMCDIQGLACLYKNKEELQLNYDCSCPASCEEIYYETVHVASTRVTSKELVSRGSRGLVRLNTLPTVRIRRHAIRDMLSFVAPMERCGIAECTIPCAGAAPPPGCPAVLPNCTTGCACMNDCERHATICFPLKYCALQKKYYKRRPKLSTRTTRIF